jgi:CubicO group peptidase (beta-lactamase class C family)
MARVDDATPRPRKLNTTAPFLTNDLDIWGDEDVRWSLAFLVNTQAGPHGRAPGSLAWAGLANSYYWIDRKNRLAGVFMTQLLPFADANALALFADFERAVYTA